MLKDNILNFHENLEGQREFIFLIEPFLDDYGKQINERHKKALEPLDLARKRHFAETEEEKDQYDKELKEVFNGDVEIVIHEKNGGDGNQSDDKSNKIITRYRVKGDTSAIDEAFKEFAKTKFHKDQLYKNSLIGLLSTVEWFFSQILHTYYDKYPDAAGIKNKTLTLEDLKTFTSIKNAETFLIENKIEEILRGNIKDWFKILKDDLKLERVDNYVKSCLVGNFVA